MKIVIAAGLLFGFSSCTHYLKAGNACNDISVLKSQTVDIMHRLNFPVRRNIMKDDSLVITVFDGRFMTCSYSQYSVRPFDKLKGVDTNLRWYIKPKIAMSSILDSIYRRKRDTSQFIYIKALGSIVHELAHYLQNEWVSDEGYITFGWKNPKAYFLQPVEFQAYAIEGYYVLNFTDRQDLQRIMGCKKCTLKKKREMLAAECIKVEYPGLNERLRIFDLRN